MRVEGSNDVRGWLDRNRWKDMRTVSKIAPCDQDLKIKEVALDVMEVLMMASQKSAFRIMDLT